MKTPLLKRSFERKYIYVNISMSNKKNNLKFFITSTLLKDLF